MSQSTDSAAGATNETPQRSGYVCPFCGVASESERGEGAACPRCGISDTPSTRKATKLRIGPWHVRQMKNPWAPGMRWETLLVLVRRGQITANTIVRGPTTHQLWRRAARVKGLSREFGVCYSCGEALAKDANLCAHCNRLQEPPMDPDMLVESREMVRDARNESAPRQRVAERVETPVMRSAPEPDRREPPTGSLQRRHRDSEAEQGHALLSARELAAAFKLDFAPQERRRRPILRAMVKILIVVLLCGGIGATLYVRPQLGTSAWKWTQRQYHALRGKTVSPHTHKAAVKAADANAEFSNALDHAIKPKWAAPLLPTNATPAPVAVPKPPRQEIAPQPAARPVATTAARKAPPAAPAPAVDPVDEARALWRQAIDAEANKDFVEAIKCYEQIKKLPPDDQPAGVDVRLEMARKQLP